MPHDTDLLTGTEDQSEFSISSRAQIAFVYRMGCREQPGKCRAGSMMRQHLLILYIAQHTANSVFLSFHCLYWNYSPQNDERHK